MSVYPLFLVLGGDGTIGAYAREDILQIDLVQNKRAGDPARQVYKLDEHQMTVTYKSAPEYGEFIEPVENLCPRHRLEALPAPTAQVCVQCAAEQRAKGRSA